METQLGKDIVRKEAWNKVTGAAKYTGDIIEQGMLYAKLLTSPHAHAQIISIDTSKASCMPGIKSVITGNDTDLLCGVILRDRPPLAKGKVRYFGEPVAMVIADNEQNAKAAVANIQVEYVTLPVINSIAEAIKPDPILIHENTVNYQRAVSDIYPIPNTNICHCCKVRKGDLQKGWAESDITVECTFSLPQSDHAAMETRAATCKIYPDGRVVIQSSTQAPFSVKEEICEYFNVPEGNVIIQVPFVGGGFGGKAPVQLEVLAYIAARTVPGKSVKLANTREEDIVTSPCHIGIMAAIKLGAKKDGKITAAEMTFHMECGAYAEIGPRMAKAILTDSAGPYNIENIQVDCYTVYTNHSYATSFRGFGHTSHAFCLERMIDKLACSLQMDPFEIRHINAVKEGNFTPTQVKVTLSNTGNLDECLNKLKNLINWDEGPRTPESNNLIRAKGIACFAKTSDSETNSLSSVLLTFNKDGSINLSCGVIEIGPGMKTTMAQILAEKMKMSIDRIFVKMYVDTETTPKHWKTVASMSTILAGRAVLNAAQDVIHQLISLGAVVLRCPPEDLEVADEKVYVKADPSFYVSFKDLVHGYEYTNGNSVMGPIIGRGSYIMNHLTLLNPETGKGKPGHSWTVGAQAVEVEYDTKQHTYRLLKAATVIDAGKVLNPKTAKGIIMGGMCMGLGLGTDEEFIYDSNGIMQNTSFRTYKMLRYGETPDYLVEFVETPQIDTPFGARGISEHGIIGMPAALSNALSLAAQIDITEIPISSELIWKKKTCAPSDTPSLESFGTQSQNLEDTGTVSGLQKIKDDAYDLI